MKRERWDTPDGDFLDLDWLAYTPNTQSESSNAPLIVLLHGLEGSSKSHYARHVLAACIKRGWPAVVPHFRGCSGELNRLPRAYHSGDSAELAWLLPELAHRSGRRLAVIGISLGGNMLAKYLGELGQSQVMGSANSHGISGPTVAAVVSAPVDLHQSAIQLSGRIHQVYMNYFLPSLKKKIQQKMQQHTSLQTDARIQMNKVLAAKTFFDFDEYVTAPLHGFDGAIDYWTRSSCAPWLKHIQVPTLVLNALNDPFLPIAALPKPNTVSQHVVLEQPDHGGHSGFYDRKLGMQWLPERLLSFFSQQLAAA
jgi:uncharacterized protein